jgi:hypothetical protein
MPLGDVRLAVLLTTVASCGSAVAEPVSPASWSETEPSPGTHTRGPNEGPADATTDLGPSSERAVGPSKFTNDDADDEGGCMGRCEGRAPPELSQAIQVRAAESRRCYNMALQYDRTLHGSVTLSMRIGPRGQVCSMRVISKDEGMDDV